MITLEQNNFKECPFCGKTDATTITTCVEMAECENFEGCEVNGYYTVVCDFNKGGCGASCGYAPTKKEAEEKWNKRAE